MLPEGKEVVLKKRTVKIFLIIAFRRHVVISQLSIFD